MKTVFRLCAETKRKTGGYFDIAAPDGRYDPSGLVKGWSIYNGSKILEDNGFHNFYIDAGGDVQVRGKSGAGKTWAVGIRNPFRREEIIKVLYVRNEGVATSGTYVRGQHIYNPREKKAPIADIVG